MRLNAVTRVALWRVSRGEEKLNGIADENGCKRVSLEQVEGLSTSNARLATRRFREPWQGHAGKFFESAPMRRPFRRHEGR
jgi:hypothetical protein